MVHYIGTASSLWHVCCRYIVTWLHEINSAHTPIGSFRANVEELSYLYLKLPIIFANNTLHLMKLGDDADLRCIFGLSAHCNHNTRDLFKS